MAGHSHASNVAARKEKQNAKKAKLNTRLAREVSMAAKDGPNPELNVKLRNAMAKARSMGLPKENIERAVKNANGEKDGAHYENVTYEAYWNNIAIIVTVETDNRARTAPEIKSTVSKNGGAIGEPGSALFLFENLGMIFLRKNLLNIEDEILEEIALLEYEASDVEKIDDETTLICFPIDKFNEGNKKITEDFAKFIKKDNKGNEDAGFIEDSFIGWNPVTTIKIDNKEKEEGFLKLIRLLEELDDVINVFHNAEL